MARVGLELVSVMRVGEKEMNRSIEVNVDDDRRFVSDVLKNSFQVVFTPSERFRHSCFQLWVCFI